MSGTGSEMGAGLACAPRNATRQIFCVDKGSLNHCASPGGTVINPRITFVHILYYKFVASVGAFIRIIFPLTELRNQYMCGFQDVIVRKVFWGLPLLEMVPVDVISFSVNITGDYSI
jgi:hypothetical protein